MHNMDMKHMLIRALQALGNEIHQQATLYTVVKILEKSTKCHRFGKYCQKLGNHFSHYIPSSLVSKILEWNGKN